MSAASELGAHLAPSSTPQGAGEAVQPRLGEIALLIQGDDNYGVGQVARETVALLPGIRCVAFCDGTEAEDIRRLGTPVHLLPGGVYFRGFVPGAGAVRALRQILQARHHWVRCAHELHTWCERQGVRVLHGNVWAHYFTLSALRRAHPGRYRVIWHTHNFLNLDRHFGLRGRFNLWQVRRGADWLLCVSHAVAAGWGRSGVPTRVVHNSVPSRLAGLPEAAPFSQRRRPDVLRLVGAGRMEWSKGHHVTIEAVARLRNSGVPATLDLFGGPVSGNAYCDELRSQIHRLGLDPFVALRGYANDLPQRLPDYDIAVQARIDPEPCALYILECLFQGMPLAASSGGGTPELLRDGREGRLYTPGDSGSLAEAVAWLAENPARTDFLSGAARRRCLSEFSPARFARKLSDFYAEIQGNCEAGAGRAGEGGRVRDLRAAAKGSST